MEDALVDPQPVLSVGSRLSSGAMFSSPGPRRKYSEATLAVSPFIHFDSAKLSRKKMKGDSGKLATSKTKTIAFGIINGGVMIPTMVGFASIIYKDQFFVENEYLPQAIKLVFLSSAIHQLCFIMFSTLPFAVGQVQDAGLIFLSSMAATIVANMKDFQPDEQDTHKVMTTTVVTLSFCTAILGCLLVLTGKLKLARLIQYLPLPVVGGYLAFIGLFCGLSGLHLTTGERYDSVLDLTNLFHKKPLKLLIPGALATAVLFFISKRARGNQFALPMAMVAMPTAFYLILLVTGHSLEDARNAGWVAPRSEVPPFYEVFKLFEFSKVEWSCAFPNILPTFFAMFAVVAFGSSLDVAAIQFELGKPMDYDHELVTVGYSNALSGLTGGYTGSYIFSQTIFTLRNGIDSRLCGLVVSLVEFALFLLPIDLLSLLPRFFFGSVLLFVAIDLLLEWLVLSWFMVEWREYVVLWFTFIFINVWGLEAGMALGIAGSAMLFVYSYSSGSNTEVVSNASSRALRSYVDRNILNKHRKRIVALRLTGYHFFGTVIGTIVDIQSRVVIPDLTQETSNHNQTQRGWGRATAANASQDDATLRLAQQRARALEREIAGESPSNLSQASGTPKNTRKEQTGSVEGVTGRGNRSMSFGSHGDDIRRSPKKKKQLRMMYDTGAGASGKEAAAGTSAGRSETGASAGTSAVGTTSGNGSPSSKKELVETRFVVLDFSYSSGIDATSARACFLTVLQSLNQHNIQLVLAGLTDSMRQVLKRNDVLKPDVGHSEGAENEYQELGDVERGDDDGAVDHDYALEFPTLDDALQYCEEGILGAVIQKEVHPQKHGFFSNSALQSVKTKYFTDIVAEKGTVIFRKGTKADSLYVVDTGRVDRVESQRQFSGGSIFGFDDFFMSQNYSYTAKADRHSVVHCLSRPSFEKMKKDDPDLAVILQQAFISQMVRLGQ